MCSTIFLSMSKAINHSLSLKIASEDGDILADFDGLFYPWLNWPYFQKAIDLGRLCSILKWFVDMNHIHTPT